MKYIPQTLRKFENTDSVLFKMSHRSNQYLESWELHATIYNAYHPFSAVVITIEIMEDKMAMTIVAYENMRTVGGFHSKPRNFTLLAATADIDEIQFRLVISFFSRLINLIPNP